MKFKLLLLTLLISSGAMQAQYRGHDPDHRNDNDHHHHDPYYSDESKIQVALLLDVSGSMEGLIDQAKSQLWHIVNGLTEEYDYGYMPELEIALFEYGKQRLGSRNGYMRQIVPFTTDLDWISEEMFYMTIGGGREYCGEAIHLAVNSLRWSRYPEDLKMIFIAGNESFDQGDVSFRRAIRSASELDIAVNTIYCGSYYKGKSFGWQLAADIGGGEYMNIDHNSYIRYQGAPQDDRLTYLNSRFNDTYIPYGVYGVKYKKRQIDQDRNAGKYGVSYQSQRTITKASGSYKSHDWDLIDAIDAGKVNLADIPNHHLPVEMRKMNMSQKRAYIAKKKSQRENVRTEIRTLAKKRKVSSEKPKRSPSSGNTQPRIKSLDKAILQSTKKQREKKAEVIRQKKVGELSKSKRPSSSQSIGVRTPTKEIQKKTEVKNNRPQKPVNRTSSSVKSTREVETVSKIKEGEKKPEIQSHSSAKSAREAQLKRLNRYRRP